jgi:hypothetical protein
VHLNQAVPLCTAHTRLVCKHDSKELSGSPVVRKDQGYSRKVICVMLGRAQSKRHGY